MLRIRIMSQENHLLQRHSTKIKGSEEIVWDLIMEVTSLLKTIKTCQITDIVQGRKNLIIKNRRRLRSSQTSFINPKFILQ